MMKQAKRTGNGQVEPRGQVEPQILVYGLPEGEDRPYMEQLLSTQCQFLEEVERIKMVASRDGFHSFRVTTYDGSAPDFTRVLSK